MGQLVISASDGHGGGDLLLADAEAIGELRLEVKKGALAGRMSGEMAEAALQQIEYVRSGMIGFGDQIDELDEIGGELQPLIIEANALVRFEQDRFAQGVQFTRPAARELNLATMEKIERSPETAARLARSFGHRLQLAGILSEPGDDQARFAEFRFPQEDGGGVFQGTSPWRRGALTSSASSMDFSKMGCSLGAAPLTVATHGKFMSEPTTKPASPPIDQTGMTITYANVCRIAQTPNEVIIDFGMNPNFFGTILDEPLKLENRVIMSHDAAKRLCLHLMATIQNFESKYGAIELDVAKRLKPQAPQS
jgi:hypothetical protein